MPAFRLRRLDGNGSNVGGLDALRGDDSLMFAAAAADAAATADLTTQIAMAAAAQAQADATAGLTTQITLRADASAQADATAALSDYIPPLPTDHAWRRYEQYLRGPVSAPAYWFGSLEEIRGGAWHGDNISEFSEPGDNAPSDFGIQIGGGFSVTLVSTQKYPLDLAALAAALRGQEMELELVTRLFGYDGAVVQVISHVRRAIVKRVVRKKSVLTLTLADIDLERLDEVFPFDAFTVEDFPRLFSEHVGRRIPQGVGTVRRVPLTWISDAGPHKYAGPKVLTAPGTLLTVYRGDAPGNGAVVDASEYTPGTFTGAVSGSVVNMVSFAEEQIDFSGRPHVLEADYLLPGSRQPTDEAKRILALYGISTDVTTFTAAAAYDTASGIAVDCLHGGEDGRGGRAIVLDLLRVARAWLKLTATGEWAIEQDRPKVPLYQYNAQADQIDIEEYGDAEIPKTVSIEYRPRRAGADLEGRLKRTTSGSSGELVIQNPYISDHVVADRLLSYHQARANTLRNAIASLHAAQLSQGDVIQVTDSSTWSGRKYFVADGITRPSDRNRLQLREYDASVHTYVPGTLPTGASNTYGPDYSFTRPAAPTGVTVVSQGTRADPDGKVVAFALIRATPPAANWARLMAVITNTTTNEEYFGQLVLVSGNYEATITGLRPNMGHNVVTWAVNASDVDGFTSSPVTFTSADDTTAPGTPSTPTVGQLSPRQVQVNWPRVTDVAGHPKVFRYVLEKKIGGGSFTEITRTTSRVFVDDNVNFGTGYQYRVAAETSNGVVGSFSSAASITPTQVIDDGYVIGQGISGTSIADASINRSRGYTGTGSQSGTLFGSSTVSIGADRYMFVPGVGVESALYPTYFGPLSVASLGVINDQATWLLINGTANTGGYTAAWRTFLT